LNLTRPSEVKALLDRLEFHPNRTLGQNFLIDANILRIILETAALDARDTVLEIGAGLGVLTTGLIEQAHRVIAVEKDPKLYAWLKEYFAETENLTLIHDDALKLDCAKLVKKGVNKIISNLPYSVSSRIIFEWSIAAIPLEILVVTVQKEVADRLSSKEGVKDYGLLSIIAQLRYDIKIIKEISPTCFLPAPEIKSAIVSLKLRAHPMEPVNRKHLIQLLKTCFNQRRKKISNVLSKQIPTEYKKHLYEILKQVEIDDQARPENVSVQQWVTLSNILATHNSARIG